MACGGKAPPTTTPMAATAEEQVKQGGELHGAHCAKCHGASGEGGEKARQMIESMVMEPEVGKTYEGPVKSTTAFGAFVEILPGVEGLLHISELQHGRTEKTEDVVKKGDVVKVKLLEVDEKGRMKLSRKALIPKE